jgi:putative FmdB family regulatory protein
MPIYEYQCATCDVRFDRMRPMSQADEAAQCPGCGALAARCASTFASRGSNGKMASGSSGGGCSGCAGGSCASCGGH